MTNTLNLNQKADTLAIDALVQFRSGVDRVRIGMIGLTAEESFDFARNEMFDLFENDEERTINAIAALILKKTALWAHVRNMPLRKELEDAYVQYMDVENINT